MAANVASEHNTPVGSVTGWVCWSMMLTPGGAEPVAGVCHARGGIADLPSEWLVDIIVGDVGQCTRRCVANGGTLLVDPRELGKGRFCVIEDPQGAVMALCQEPSEAAG